MLQIKDPQPTLSLYDLQRVEVTQQWLPWSSQEPGPPLWNAPRSHQRAPNVKNAPGILARSPFSFVCRGCCFFLRPNADKAIHIKSKAWRGTRGTFFMTHKNIYFGRVAFFLSSLCWLDSLVCLVLAS